MTSHLLRAACAALALAAATATASAANRHVDIINKSGVPMKHFYASTTGTNSWEEDILGRDVIADGDTFDIDIDDGSGKCRYDFKAVFENGQELVRKNIDVCTVTSFTVNR